jgi:hypothetical protein
MRGSGTSLYDRTMRALFLTVGVTCVAFSALAQQPDPVGMLADELKSKMPPKWEAHVRWREGDQLLATIIPWPYQEAFALWYDQSKLASTLAALCPKADEPIWSLIDAKQDIVLEPTVGGKTGVAARLSCRTLNSDRH